VYFINGSSVPIRALTALSFCSQYLPRTKEKAETPSRTRSISTLDKGFLSLVSRTPSRKSHRCAWHSRQERNEIGYRLGIAVDCQTGFFEDGLLVTRRTRNHGKDYLLSLGCEKGGVAMGSI
jgi:hypothetical protein